jgi:hypothetical protein
MRLLVEEFRDIKSQMLARSVNHHIDCPAIYSSSSQGNGYRKGFTFFEPILS